MASKQEMCTEKHIQVQSRWDDLSLHEHQSHTRRSIYKNIVQKLEDKGEEEEQRDY